MVNTLFVYKVAFHSKELGADVLPVLRLEEKPPGAHVEWLGKEKGAASSRSPAPPQMSTDNNKAKQNNIIQTSTFLSLVFSQVICQRV